MKDMTIDKRRGWEDATTLWPSLEANDFECNECVPTPLWKRAFSALGAFRAVTCVGVGPGRRCVPMVAIRLRNDLADCLLDLDDWGSLQTTLLDWEGRAVADGIGLSVELSRTLTVSDARVETARAMEIRLGGTRKDALTPQTSWEWFLKACRWVHLLDAACLPLVGCSSATH
ncbi:MAG TPA: hypothetical protein PKM25_15570 [Candidatus Ozemobacteraceae bacterium]|nr:hypothetical protein [Candidatus Ozemobacteraceae bacterium]